MHIKNLKKVLHNDIMVLREVLLIFKNNLVMYVDNKIILGKSNLRIDLIYFIHSYSSRLNRF